MAIVAPQIGRPDLVEHTGFILAEDEAIKNYFSGIKVPERPGQNPPKMVDVGVWFRFPEGERQIQYPFITLDLLTVEPAFELFTSVYMEPLEGLYQPSVSPTLPDVSAPGLTFAVPNYLPFRLVYQVMVHCRSSLHDRYLLSLFMTDLIQTRPFWLGVDADNTWRRMEKIGFNQADVPETTESGTKRIFRKVYTVSLLAEVPQAAFIESYQVLRTFISVTDLEMMDQYYENILKGQSDPLNTFTQAERDAQGELATVWHEGRVVSIAEEVL